MSAEKAIYHLLTNDTALNEVVPKCRIYPSLIPLGTALPAIAYMLVSTTEQTSFSMTQIRLRSRIQITIAAMTYPEVKDIVALVVEACNYKQGTFNGVQVDSVIRDVVGADFRDDEVGIFYSTVDFSIAHGN
jgi:hypothetical protein